MPGPSLAPEILEARRAGGRLLAFGALLLMLGLALLVFVDRDTQGGVFHARIGQRGMGFPFLVGLPATIGYVVGSLGVYRLLSGRGPGHASRSLPSLVLRAVFVLAVGAIFFGGAFVIVLRMRG